MGVPFVHLKVKGVSRRYGPIMSDVKAKTKELDYVLEFIRFYQIVSAAKIKILNLQSQRRQPQIRSDNI